ncbi:MurR/RpiR family transcriptional regulator [Kribbella sp. NBC_01245]|uniref:MurR/RpiR family transcriptional regulator n=1 Tax=Kribbella sp. NBC_01245 TaxID=2903578 RepID=UPI002E2C7CAB|nr:MurR/RpiR family transcriptional regulator [Kribbella sp. NBC_01245]
MTLDSVRAANAGLTGSLRRIADFVLTEPSVAARLTITELAERTGTSQGTVTRFCRACGLKGYAELRVAMAEEVGRSGAQRWSDDIGREIGPDDTTEQVLKVLVATNTQALARTAEQLDLTAVDDVVAKLVAARHCHFFGIGTSGVSADELRRRLQRIAIPCWSSTDVHTGIVAATLADTTDVFVGISSSGQVVETIEVLQTARRAGATTVAITAQPQSPLAEVADLVLATSSQTSIEPAGALADRHAQFLILDILYTRIAQTTHGQTLDLLVSTAEALDSHRVPAPPDRRPRRRKPSSN